LFDGNEQVDEKKTDRLNVEFCFVAIDPEKEYYHNEKDVQYRVSGNKPNGEVAPGCCGSDDGSKYQ
jgi:hypothetical protein